jgi:pimeloyl-ACP methyl ester carboxylesterase
MRDILSIMMAAGALTAASDDIDSRVEHGYADSAGVKIHYATIGKGPLVVMIHGFPDFWYTWRNQMDVLSRTHQCVAIDMRGYNLSDKPPGVENYDMRLLVGDVVAVIKHFKQEKAVIAGHDWGGAVAWQTAMHVPQMVERLIIVNLPHPHGLARELASNPQQQKNSQYARNFQLEGAHLKLSPEALANMAPEPVRPKYREAFTRSNIEAMLNFYKRNYPKEPYQAPASPPIKVQAPVLMFHGLKDWALLPGALNGTWDWVEKDLTLVTIPGAGHWSHWEAAEHVSRTMLGWLTR